MLKKKILSSDLEGLLSRFFDKAFVVVVVIIIIIIIIIIIR
jgi:hypothetical protein